MVALQHLTREYSQRLGVLTGAQLQAALDRFVLGRLLDAAPLRGGLFGQNVFLTASTGEYVLRGKPHFDWQFPAERYFTDRIHAGTAVPRSLAVPARRISGHLRLAVRADAQAARRHPRRFRE